MHPPSVAPRADLPPRATVSGVPFTPQTGQQCGPAALSMALDWSGSPVQIENLASEVMSPARNGSLQASLVSAARRHGRLAYEIAGPDGLYDELAAGYPVIALQNLGLAFAPAWHYAVLTGYDRPAGTVRMHSGTHEDLARSTKLFLRTWARSDYWGLVVLPPGAVPASAQPLAYLEAATGLERAGHLPAAITAYEAATRRWPQQADAWLALGNARHAHGDLHGAESALRSAVRYAPQHGPALNNLAQVLLERGAADEALVAARQAVGTGGAFTAQYQATLEAAQEAASAPAAACPCDRLP